MALEIPTSFLPSGRSVMSGVGGTVGLITIIIIVFIILAAAGVFVWILVRNLQFNKRIMIFETRNGMTEWLGQDRAREVVYNMSGDSVFFLKKRKKYLPRGEVKVGKNRYIYTIRSDGEWVNSSLEDLDAKLRTIGVKPIHPDMRAFKAGMEEVMKKRYEKKSLMKEWLPVVVPIILFIICGLVLYFVADRLVTFLNKLPEVLDAAAKVQDKSSQILASMNNICGSSGIK